MSPVPNGATNDINAHSPRWDVVVAYRIYPKVAKSALGLPFGEDKLQLSEMCLHSFKQCLANLRVKLWVLLDGCSAEYCELFQRHFKPENLVLLSLPTVGNKATFDKQIDILLEQDECEVVYFAEDDYFYLPGHFRLMVDFLLSQPDVHFVSPYDHLDCYTKALHERPKWINVFGGRHWRTAASTCLTFLTTRQTLRETEGVFRSYRRRNFDCSLWLSLTKARVFNPVFFARQLVQHPFFCKIILKSWLYCWRQILFGRKWKLWIPIPAFATHLDSSALSPNVNWNELMIQKTEADACGR
jgi:hypothetical protein